MSGGSQQEASLIHLAVISVVNIITASSSSTADIQTALLLADLAPPSLPSRHDKGAAS